MLNKKFNIQDLWKDNLDNKEYDRQLSEHYACFTILNKNFISPIDEDLKKGICVLDIGCGCGIWILDNAYKFENSIFIGLDIVDYFPNNILPNNVIFYHNDFVDNNIQKIIKNNSINFIYHRHMIASYTNNEWDIVINKIYNLLKTDGYVELTEFDIKNSDVGPLTKKINDCIIKILKNNKNDMNIFNNLENRLINNGFKKENITLKCINVSLNNDYLKEDFILGFIRLKKGIIKLLNISEDEFFNILIKIKEEWKENKSYIKLFIISAKK